ncbi:MAG: hypothetical protein IJJ26_09590 [Victivallales bacterium]|nr:hypothetical protein [Victivallales bacterium]
MRFTSDSLNPVFLKEIRQMFRNRSVLILTSLLLIGEIAMLLIVRFFADDIGDSDELGQICFIIQMAAISLVILLMTGFVQCSNFAKERQNMDLDYSRLSVLTPFTIVCGKVLTSVAMIAFIFSMCLPFMFIAYFLGGISIMEICSIVLALMPVYFLISLVSVLLGATGMKSAETLTVLLGAPSLLGLGVNLAIYSSGWRHSRHLSYILRIEFGILLVAGLFFAWSIGVLTQRKANTMFWSRVYILLIAVLGPVLFLLSRLACWPFTHQTPYFVYFFLGNPMTESYIQLCVWVIVWTACVLLVVAGSLGERMEPGPRVMAERPRNRFLRLLHFLCSSGRAGALVLGWLLFLPVFLSLVCGLADWSSESIIWLLATLPLYLLFYAQASAILVRYFPSLGWAAVVIVIGVFVVFPVLCIALCPFESNASERIWLLTTPFGLELGDPTRSVAVSAVLAIVSGCWLLPYYCDNLRRHLYEEVPPPPVLHKEEQK